MCNFQFSFITKNQIVHYIRTHVLRNYTYNKIRGVDFPVRYNSAQLNPYKNNNCVTALFCNVVTRVKLPCYNPETTLELKR